MQSGDWQKKEKSGFGDIIKGLLEIQLKMRRLMGLLPSFMELLGGITVALVLLYGAYQVIHFDKDPGTFFSFIIMSAMHRVAFPDVVETEPSEFQNFR